jgi:hypothetical protein
MTLLEKAGQLAVSALAFLPDENTLAACFLNWVWLYQTSDGSIVQQFYAKQEYYDCNLSSHLTV